MRRHHLSALLAVISLAAPASAAAQSAGDNQYVDPFTRPEKPAQTPQAPAQTPTPAPTAAAPQAPLQTSATSAGLEDESSAPTGVASGEELPRTGPHVEATAALGLLLTASGAGLLALPGVRRSRTR